MREYKWDSVKNKTTMGGKFKPLSTSYCSLLRRLGPFVNRFYPTLVLKFANQFLFNKHLFKPLSQKDLLIQSTNHQTSNILHNLKSLKECRFCAWLVLLLIFCRTCRIDHHLNPTVPILLDKIVEVGG